MFATNHKCFVVVYNPSLLQTDCWIVWFGLPVACCVNKEKTCVYKQQNNPIYLFLCFVPDLPLPLDLVLPLDLHLPLDLDLDLDMDLDLTLPPLRVGR